MRKTDALRNEWENWMNRTNGGENLSMDILLAITSF